MRTAHDAGGDRRLLLSAADVHDVQSYPHGFTLKRVRLLEDTIAAFKGAPSTPSTPRAPAAATPPTSSGLRRANVRLLHNPTEHGQHAQRRSHMLMVCHHLDPKISGRPSPKPHPPRDDRPRHPAYDLGAFSVIASDSQAMAGSGSHHPDGRPRTRWKRQRGGWPEEAGENDTFIVG